MAQLTSDVAAGIAASSVPRKDLFLTTKFMPGHSVPSEEEVYAHLRKSIAKLDPNKVKKAGGKRKAEDADGGGEGNGSGLAGEEGYIDLFLIHAPRPNAAARAVHWAALARAQKEGWVRDIGVSNFGVAHLTALPGPTPAINQIELHPFCQQKDIVDYCREKGIVVQAYCPLVRAKPQHMENPVLVGVAKKHGKEVVHVLIRWSLQKG
jgi:diketogulonate reductase-like aldo/keto reductase